MRVTLGILLIAVGIIGAYFILSGKALSASTPAPAPAPTGKSSMGEAPPTNPSLKVPGGTIYGSGGDRYASTGGFR